MLSLDQHTCLADSGAEDVVATDDRATAVLGATLAAMETNPVDTLHCDSAAGAAGICTGTMLPPGICTITCSMYCGSTLGMTCASAIVLTPGVGSDMTSDLGTLKQATDFRKTVIGS